MKVESCRSCGAPIIWAISGTTGKRMPLDAERVLDGTVALIDSRREAPLAIVLRKLQLENARSQGWKTLYRSHFSTCPHAQAWRRAPRRQEVATP